jgi:uncharacterized BrkB/YihY/UPF0761 family membrane protein
LVIASIGTARIAPGTPHIQYHIPEHRILAIAIGVTFYALLAIFPGIAALVALYGLFADPSTISKHLADLSSVLPSGAIDVIGDQLKRLTEHAMPGLALHSCLASPSPYGVPTPG